MMRPEERHPYRMLDMFYKLRAVVASGTIDNFNCCTVGWGSIGNIWSHFGSVRPVATLYIFPTEYTREFLDANDMFTIDFFPKKYDKAVGYIGAHSGRDGDKVGAVGFTPIETEGGVAFEEADLVFVCKKLCSHQIEMENLLPEIRNYYKKMPEIYPPDSQGAPQAHVIYVGEILKVIDKRLTIGEFYRTF